MSSDCPDRLSLPAGAELFREGDEGEAAYLIESGEVEIFVMRDGQELILARRGAGEIIGEMALIDGGPRSASVRVAAECVLLPITPSQFKRRLEETDPILHVCLCGILKGYRRTVSGISGSGFAPSDDGIEDDVCRTDDLARTLGLEAELRRAVQGREFELFYQPILRLGGNRVEGFEALMRWHHPQRGLLLPGDFIPAAEASGMIVALTRFALAEAGRAQVAFAAAAGVAPSAQDAPFVTLNVSGLDLTEPDFYRTVAATLAAAGAAPNRITIEVTESLLMKDIGRACRVLTACREQGVAVAIDDFGTGYSSLSHLHRLPISTLKIDRSFVREMAADETSRRIVQTIVGLADGLGIPVVAEGIETGAQAQALTQRGCAYGQGYLFGRPAPLAAGLELVGPRRRLRTRAAVA
jgi:EAL domain-containing protein (putative c-di-GMP-specific phosphodiesterase class I)